MIRLHGDWVVSSRIDSRTTTIENEDTMIAFAASMIEKCEVGGVNGQSIYVNVKNTWDLN